MKRTAIFLPLLLFLCTGCVEMASDDSSVDSTEAVATADTGFVEVYALSGEASENGLDSLEINLPEGDYPSGTVAYTLEINLRAELAEGLSGQQKALAALLPEKMEQASMLTFWGPVGRVSSNNAAPSGGDNVKMQTMGTEMLIDLESGLKIGLTQFGSEVYGVKEQLTGEPATPTSESREILGYTCKKAEVQVETGKGIAWYTEEIPYGFSPLGSLGTPGLVLEVESPKLSIKAKEVSLKPVDRSVFDIDPATQYITEQQLKDITEEMMGQLGGATLIK